jgi:hypothetical protein
LPFIGKWVKQMWSDFGDPERALFVTYEEKPIEVKPKYIYGDLKIRVTSIKNFQDNALKRKEMSEVLTQIVPVMLSTGAVQGKGLQVLFRQYLTDRHVDDLDDIFDTKSLQQDINTARYENMAILWGGVDDMPKEDENHAVHLKEHEPYNLSVGMLPDGQRPADQNLEKMAQHIQMHKYFMERNQGQAPIQGGGRTPEAPNSAAVPTPGEMAGDQMAGDMGVMANGTAPDTGRPPMYEEMGV